jgi:hypothetical protein
MPQCARCGQPFPGEDSPDVICPHCASSMLNSAAELPDAETNLREGEDYYLDEAGMMVMTEGYLQRRGYCCENGCRHCPYTE